MFEFGYAFQEEARGAMQALGSTHLYGRHLVLEWSKPDDSLAELQLKASKQNARDSAGSRSRYQRDGEGDGEDDGFEAAFLE